MSPITPTGRARSRFTSTLRARALPAACSLALAALVLVPGGAAAATPPIRFDMRIYGPCVEGWAEGVVVSVVWKDSTGGLKAASGPDFQSDGGWWSFCPADQTVAVLPGDRITVSNGTYTRKYVVPNLTLAIDRVSNVAHGTGPAGRTITLCSGWWWYWGWGDCWGVRVGQNGEWSFNPHEDLYGGMRADVTWRSPNGDRLSLDGYAPQLGVTLGKATFSGRTNLLGDVQVLVENSHSATGMATADREGVFAGVLRDSSGDPVPVSAGDHVSAPSLAADADWIVPRIEGGAGKRSDTVNGKCYDSGTSMGYARVWVVRPDSHVRGVGYWSTEADGTFHADFTGYFGGGDVEVSANIKSGDRIKIDCIQTTGDWARWSFVVH
jgi:hypothetical protein